MSVQSSLKKRDVDPENWFGQSDDDDLKKSADGNCYLAGSLLGHGGEIAVVPFAVPSSDGCDYAVFGEKMKEEEDGFCMKLASVVNVMLDRSQKMSETNESKMKVVGRSAAAVNRVVDILMGTDVE